MQVAAIFGKRVASVHSLLNETAYTVISRQQPRGVEKYVENHDERGKGQTFTQSAANARNAMRVPRRSGVTHALHMHTRANTGAERPKPYIPKGSKVIKVIEAIQKWKVQ